MKGNKDGNATRSGQALPHDQYRAYRSQLLRETGPFLAPWPGTPASDEEYGSSEAHPWRALRQQIAAARRDLTYRHVDSWSGLAKDPDAFARRALAIPPNQRLAYPLLVRFFHAMVGVFTPADIALRLARGHLSNVRSYEGRQLVFAAVAQRWFGAGLSRDYTPALDFIIRRAVGHVTHRRLQRLTNANVHWLRSYYKLGERSVAQLAARLERRHEAHDGPLAELLVDEGAIRSPDQLAAWPTRPQYLSDFSRFGTDELSAARVIVKRLLGLGVTPLTVTKACQDDAPEFRAHRFEETVTLLSGRGIEVAPVVGAVGKLIWSAPPERWRFLLETLRLGRATDLALFVDLLSSHANLNIELAQALLARDTSAQGLSMCQPLLMLDARESLAPVRALECLSGPPFSFSAIDFARVRGYARDSCGLPEFLEALGRHGLTAPAEVLAFERCFRAFPVSSFGTLLTIALPRRGDSSLAELVDWVYRAGQSGNVEACALGADLLRIHNLPDLERLLAVLPLGASMLRYLVLEKRLESLRRLLDWFYNDAVGVLGMRLWGALGEVERLVLDDAFERRRFTRVDHNVSCLYSVIRTRAHALLGRRPYEKGAEAGAAYDAAMQQAIEGLRPALLQHARRVLSMTGGVLFTSLLDLMNPAQADARLAAVAPLLDDLLAGHGPSDKQLADIQAEAIALVYETEPTTVKDLWPHVLGREDDLRALVLADHYPMQWRQVHRRLRDGARLEVKSLSAIARLPELAAHVETHWTGDMPRACKGLRPSRLAAAAADVDDLSHHMAVLCALAGYDDQIRASLRRWEQMREGLHAGSVPYSELEHLQAFFETMLPDALVAHAAQRIRQISADHAGLLVERLGAPVQNDVTDPAARLQAAVDATLNKVRQTCRRWLARERGKFPKVRDGQGETALRAMVSKSPAAFFAKQAVGLCTRANVDMWNEHRHSHIVVFDPAQRCLAGMAMLYVEDIPAIAPRRASLILRALNPVEQFAAQHDVSTIVDAFVAVAISIAAANNLAAVAFPSAGAMDLLSNVPAVQRDIVKRYAGPARPRFDSRSPPPAQGQPQRLERVEARFDGYARGASGTVSALYVIWRPGQQERGAADAGGKEQMATRITA